MRRVPTWFLGAGLAGILAASGCTAGAGPLPPPEDTASAEAAATDAREMPLPIDAASLVRQLRARRIKKKATVLAALPAQLKQRVLFVTETGGLGKASRARPRPLHFTEDARFIVSTSGHSLDEDPTANALEILEYDEVAKSYRAHTVELDPRNGPQLIEDDARCTACHGSPARPIWGRYPDWPSAYGGSQGHGGVDDMTADERAEFAAFAAEAKTDADYRHLAIKQTPQGYRLPTPYGLPLTLFTARVGVRYATQLGARVEAHPMKRTLEYALLEESAACTPSVEVRKFVDARYEASLRSDAALAAVNARFPATRTATKLYRLVGIEPTKDLRLELPVATAPTGAWEVGMNDWSAGGDSLPKLVGVQILERVLDEDAELAALYATTRSRIRAIGAVAFRADALTLAALNDDSPLKYVDSVFPFVHFNVHYPVLNGPTDTYPGEGKRAVACALLDARQRARQAE